jgi:hypothetical protein
MISVKVDVDDSLVQNAMRLLDGILGGPSLGLYLKTGGAQVLQNRASARFDNEGDDASGPWAPLSPVTQRIRRSLGYGPSSPINVRTGKMKEWILSDSGIHTNTASAATMVWPGPTPTNVISRKFATAQTGERSSAIRPVVAANAVDLDLLLNGVAHWVTELAGIELTN